MATRPWVLPSDVIAYTAHADVAARSVDKLKFDISRAEVKIIAKTHNDFTDPAKYATIPEPVEMATILLAEAYAKNAIEDAKVQLKSETFDDYSYTAESGRISIDDLDIDDLLSDYVLPTGSGKVVMRMRKL